MNIKSALRVMVMVMVMEGMEMVPNILHISSTYGSTYMSPLSPYGSLIMPSMWHFGW